MGARSTSDKSVPLPECSHRRLKDIWAPPVMDTITCEFEKEFRIYMQSWLGTISSKNDMSQFILRGFLFGVSDKTFDFD